MVLLRNKKCHCNTTDFGHGMMVAPQYFKHVNVMVYFKVPKY